MSEPASRSAIPRGNGPMPRSSNVAWEVVHLPKLRSFLGEFLETIEELATQNYFTRSVGGACIDDNPCYWMSSAVEHKIALYGLDLRWPLSNDDLRYVSDDEITGYVELFYRLVSAPLNEWFHQYCGTSHPKDYDDKAGRYEYTKRVNAIFKRNNPELRLDAGKVVASGSKVLAPRLADLLPYGGDGHLETLVESGIRKFRSGQPDEQASAITDMANALERVKTSLDRQDKRRSAQLLAKAMSPDDVLQDHFDGLLRNITNLSNGLAIRHHEHNRTPVADNIDLVEFMFYSYYNIIRYALKQTNKFSAST